MLRALLDVYRYFFEVTNEAIRVTPRRLVLVRLPQIIPPDQLEVHTSKTPTQLLSLQGLPPRSLATMAGRDSQHLLSVHSTTYDNTLRLAEPRPQRNQITTLGLGLVVAGGLLVLATQTSSPQELWAAFSATPATIRPQPAPQVYARQATSFARGVPMQQVEVCSEPTGMPQVPGSGPIRGGGGKLWLRRVLGRLSLAQTADPDNSEPDSISWWHMGMHQQQRMHACIFGTCAHPYFATEPTPLVSPSALPT